MRWLLRAVLLTSVGGCGSMLRGSSADGDTSPQYEPPPAWQSGIQFHFADSTWATELRYGARIEFFDGRGHRIATGRDVFQDDGGAVHTPWHRLSLPTSGELPVSLRITIGDPAGGRTTVEYTVLAKRDQFYGIYLGVYTHLEEPHRLSVLRDMRSFGVTPAARREPSDSLWVGHHITGRYCFNCPF